MNKHEWTSYILTPFAVLLACSTVDRGDSGPPKTTQGERWCYRFPDAAAPDLATQAMTGYPETPEYCYCVEDPDDISQTLAEQAQANALAECILDAETYGLDVTQTNCGEVMEGPFHGDADGNFTCTLYWGAEFSNLGDGGSETGGRETGGASLDDPGTLALSAYRPVPDATASSVDWSGGGVFESVPLSCDLNLDCCELFEADICRYTDPAYPMAGGAADWSVADATTGIEVAYQGCPVAPGPELVVEGRADYSVTNCEDARCPVYLAALELELPAGASGRFSTALFDGRCADKRVERFELRLVHAALGSRDPLSDRVAFPVGALVFETFVDLSAEPGDFGAGEYSFLAFNDRVVWGHAGADRGLRFEPSSLSFEELGFELGLSFEAQVVGAPPEVEVKLPESLECEEQGEAVLWLEGTASDADDDLLSSHWLLGGELLLGERVELPVGAHELSYRAVDRRGASTVGRATVRVEDTGAPALSVERSQAVSGCDGSTSVTLAVPSAAEACTPEEVLVRGAVVAREGEPLAPPLEVGADGSVVLEPGQYTLEWRASDAWGNEAVAAQLLSCRG